MRNNIKKLFGDTICVFILFCLFITSCERYSTDYDETTSKKNKIETTVETETTESKIVETTEIKETELSLSDIQINEVEIDKLTNYNVVKFGKYEQDNYNSNGAEDIEWLILDKTDNSYLLLSKYILDCKNFNVENNFVSFSNSTLCGWLNESFYNVAFDNSLKRYIVNDTKFTNLKYNKVSLLDVESCLKYFGNEQPTNEKLQAVGTDYAIFKGLEVDTKKDKPTYKMGSYFLTDNGETKDKVVWVGMYGHIYLEGQSVKLNVGDGVRPIIAIDRKLFPSNLTRKIDLNLANIKNDLNESLDEDNEQDESEEVENSYEESLETESEKTEKEKLLYYSNYEKTKYKSPNCPVTENDYIDLEKWEYGTTPLEWIYVVPNTQIIANNRPNSSKKFSYKSNASSGSKGCYVPIFNNSISHGIDYEGRFYSIEDYDKFEPEEMKFKNKFSDLKYGDYNIKELLEKKYEVESVTSGIAKIGDVYINVIYAEELDEIIEKY